MVIDLQDIHKSFASGFLMRKKPVLCGLSMQLHQGDAYALLGANGAGKSTTLRILLGLSRADCGGGQMLGFPLGDRRSHQRLGYLPESPSFHEHLTAFEFLTYCGQLVGLRRDGLVRRIDVLLERVELQHARERKLRKMSKGMLQRIGLCQALLGDPELLILDEPMSGLDPPGRKLVRDLILEQRHAGKTVLFSTHILSDAEIICTRAGILRQGRIASEVQLDSLKSSQNETAEVVLSHVHQAALSRLRQRALEVVQGQRHTMFQVTPGKPLHEFLQEALSLQTSVVSVTPRRASLEDLYTQAILPESAAPVADREAQPETVSAGGS